jgi:hypothetical protein
MLVFLRDGQWRDHERADERRGNCNLHHCRFAIG